MVRGFLRKVGASLHAELSFHFLIDVTTLIASIATVVALVILIHDRPEQANVAAWQILQNYLQSPSRASFNEGQGFALETLAKNGVRLDHLDAHGIYLDSTDLRGALIGFASFQGASFDGVDLRGAYMSNSVFEDASIALCKCQGADFIGADLKGVRMQGGDYREADFNGADISDLAFNTWLAGPAPKLNTDALLKACFEAGHEPNLQGSAAQMPSEPQSEACKYSWGASWSARKRPGVTH